MDSHIISEVHELCISKDEGFTRARVHTGDWVQDFTDKFQNKYLNS